MATEFHRVIDPTTGFPFVEAAAAEGVPELADNQLGGPFEDLAKAAFERSGAELDLITSAALCEVEADFLVAFGTFKLHEEYPSIEEELKTATERGVGGDPLPEGVRMVDLTYIHIHARNLKDKASELRRAADSDIT